MLADVYPIGVIGIFAGGYNHAVKNALYVIGAPSSLMLTLFPPPTYVMPDDVVFELSGVLQFFLGAWAAYDLWRFVEREMIATRAGRSRPGTDVGTRFG